MAASETDGTVDRFARGIAAELRQFVRSAGRRRALEYTAYVGVPGAARTAFAHDPDHDPVLRADLVERAVDALPERLPERGGACAWVTRPDGFEVDTRDHQWFVASRTGFERHSLELPAFFVVGRYGWLEVLSGRTRTWTRVRPSGAATPVRRRP